jgi:hypothetical protein
MPGLATEPGGVPAQVILDKGRDKEIGMVVAPLQPQRERNPCLLTGLLQQLRLQLCMQKPIPQPLIDEEIVKPCPALDQSVGILRLPGLAVIAEIAAERFFAPGASHRR